MILLDREVEGRPDQLVEELPELRVLGLEDLARRMFFAGLLVHLVAHGESHHAGVGSTHYGADHVVEDVAIGLAQRRVLDAGMLQNPLLQRGLGLSVLGATALGGFGQRAVAEQRAYNEQKNSAGHEISLVGVRMSRAPGGMHSGARLS